MTGDPRIDLPVARPARTVCRVLRGAGHEAYVVGGAVRDALLGRPVAEWDVTTGALPDEVMALFRRTIPTGVDHGTVTVVIGGTPIEVTTYRGEGTYSDARRPDEVHFGVPLREDLARRDFTINAIAYDPDSGRLVDPFDGRGDLERRVLRAVGDPRERFREDGLRVMRAVRFVAALGFDVDPATEAAIPGALPSLRKVSAERVRVELFKLLAAPHAARGLAVAERTGVLDAILPERSEPIAVVDALPPDAPLRFAALIAGADARTAGRVARRLRLSNEDRRRVERAIEHGRAAYGPDWTDADVRRFVARAGRAHAMDAALVARAVHGAADLPDRVRAVLDRGEPVAVGDLAITGADVMRILGVPPGPEVGRALDRLLDAVLEDPSQNTPDALAARLAAGE